MVAAHATMRFRETQVNTDFVERGLGGGALGLLASRQEHRARRALWRCDRAGRRHRLGRCDRLGRWCSRIIIRVISSGSSSGSSGEIDIIGASR